MRSPASCLTLCVLLACDQPTVDRCAGDQPVQLVRSDNPRFHVDFAGGHTFVSFDGQWVSDLDHALYVGEACGADAREIAIGLDASPVRAHPGDPDADDPRLVCDHVDGYFLRIDPAGERPPELLLSRFNCGSLVMTPHGAVVGERQRHALWHLPNFPDDADAVELTGAPGLVEYSTEAYIRSARWFNDRLHYTTRDGIRRRDLATGADELLIPGAAEEFAHTETHILWKSRYMDDGASATMRVRELASGDDRDVGVYHRIDDDPTWEDRGAGWRFDVDGRHILHLPNDPASPMAAYDLTGAPVPFVATGARIAYPPRGGVVVHDGATVRHAVPGSATGAVLAVPADADLEEVQAFDDRLEVIVGTDLYAVPLDGGPSSRVLLGVGPERARVDDHLLLSITGHDLTLLHQPSNQRWRITSHAENFEYHPGRGVFFSRAEAPEAPDNGVWMLSDELLRGLSAD